MKPLPQNYDATATESRWQQHWLTQGIYHWDESAAREDTFVIDTPPPTVSGHLHMGHIFSYTQADFVARFQRMNGKTVFYPMGFDDNGLPTERLVEKEKKIQAAKYIQEHGRERFVDLCMGVSEQARQDFRNLFQSIALSVDWRQEYHTISPEVRRLSQLSFLDLMSKNAVERRLEPMLWDPVDQTAIAQAEVVDKELESTFNDIYFEVTNADGTPLSEAEFGGRKLREDSQQTAIIWRNGRSYVVIGTTRPELIPACVGVFYHAEDARYAGLKGKKAVTPLFGVKVDILTDESVEKDKGTGIMMCCTFGDEKDIEKWRKYGLPAREILNQEGRIQYNALTHPDTGTVYEIWFLNGFDSFSGGRENIWHSENTRDLNIALNFLRFFRGEEEPKGLKWKSARTKMIELLQAEGELLESRAIIHPVKCAERSGIDLQYARTAQWFVKVTGIKEELKSRSKSCNWNPDWMEKRMEQWIDGLNWDWCISRQRYSGVPFPVWYSKRAGEEGKLLLADADQLPVNPLKDLPKGYSREEVEPDTDVMDTWATSSISPQINAQSIGGGDRFAQLFPADLRPQAHEIIRTWAFYTLVKAHYHNDNIPWKNLMISGWCLAEDKSKMSKSKGNVVTPGDLLTEFSADVVRYWASTSRLGQDTAFSRDLLKIGKKLVNKLWNATKFAAIHLDKKPGAVTATLDKWILTRLHRTVAKATAEFERFEYATARTAIEDFFWKDFCDNYLELLKKRVYDEAGNDPAGQASAVQTIALCLDAILRLFAPFLPHVTEELWSHIFPEKYAHAGSLQARSTWPKAADYLVDDAATDAGILAVELLEAVRKAKSERGVSIKWPIEQMTISPLATHHSSLPDDLQLDLLATGNIHAIHWREQAASDAVTSENGNFKVSFTFAAQSDAA